uniref:Uncharacterized protein n=1 Tax=Entomoneis paludosa TaxID=265537 RepID=A0A7S2VD35_9STRA|mmetsp:Transcript_1516/g.3241  ORF Transcript_1516/g.3241 Transcript_1516/m.3241 type:complete len:101 (+) Transcript_1516:192-494(+)
MSSIHHHDARPTNTSTDRKKGLLWIFSNGYSWHDFVGSSMLLLSGIDPPEYIVRVGLIMSLRRADTWHDGPEGATPSKTTPSCLFVAILAPRSEKRKRAK